MKYHIDAGKDVEKAEVHVYVRMYYVLIIQPHEAA